MWRLPCQLVRSSIFLPIILAACVSNVLAQGATTFAQGWQSGTPATVTGVLSTQYADDFANRRSELIHMIRDERTGQSFRLRFEKEVPATVRPNAKVTISGRLRGSEIYMLADQVSSITTNSMSLQTTQTSAVVIGDQHTLVIIANFRDKTVDCLTSDIVGDLNGIMWTGTGTWPDPTYNYSVNALYREVSSGQVSFSGKVVGPYTINYSALDPCCDTNGWASAANAAAAAAGVDLNAYPRKLYYMPANTYAGFSGIADLGVTPSSAFVFDSCQSPDVFAHELGHNLGFYHASTPTDEYGDHSDIMGGAQGFFRQVDAPHRAQMGWLANTQTVTLTQDGTYHVAPLEIDPTTAVAPQALRALKSDTGEYYYLSYRRGVGFDQVLSCCSYLDRLNVHRWLDGKTYLLGALADGETFADAVTGFTVTQLAHDDTSSTALVHLGVGCGSAAPSVGLSPQSQSGAAGIALTYDIALVNKDPATCAASAFSLGQTIPPGFSATVAPSSLQLAPGATGHATLTLMPAMATATGTYNFVVNVNDPNIPAHSAAASGSDTVVIACTNAPSVTISPNSQSASPGKKLNYSVTVTNKDGAGCAATAFTVAPSVPNGWTDTLAPSLVSLGAGASATLTYSVSSAPGSAPATYGVWANVSDGVSPVHSASAAASYVVQAGDTTPPGAPTGLVAKLTGTKVNLSWKAAADNVAVSGYQVWRNGALIATTSSTSWTDQAALAGSTYTYSVAAYDAAGNVSAPSNSVIVAVSGGGRGK